jgi:hypothetical protein
VRGPAERLQVAACLVLGCLPAPSALYAHAQNTTTVQFDREIVRILDDHCAMCHAAQGPAFALITYEQTYRARWQIRMDALTHHMAPWGAVPGYGDFINDNGLTQREADFLVSWAESFGPRNDGAASPGVAAAPAGNAPVQAHVDFDHWALGTPDAVLPLAANTVAPGAEAVRRMIIDPKLTQEHWLRALEYRPGDHRVVHAATFTIQETGQWLGTWTPWYGFTSLPATLAFRLPAGSHIVAQIHSLRHARTGHRQRIHWPALRAGIITAGHRRHCSAPQQCFFCGTVAQVERRDGDRAGPDRTCPAADDPYRHPIHRDTGQDAGWCDPGTAVRAGCALGMAHCLCTAAARVSSEGKLTERG